MDEFIAYVGRKMAVILQTLKETGARIGEAQKIEWSNVLRALHHVIKGIKTVINRTQTKEAVTARVVR